MSQKRREWLRHARCAVPSLRMWITRILTATLAICIVQSALAAVYGGGGVDQGIGMIAGVGGIASDTNLQRVILSIVIWVLDIILTVAVVVIIIAGIYLIVSNGDDSSKDKAKKIVLYCIIGIILILFARVIVVVVNRIFG